MVTTTTSSSDPRLAGPLIPEARSQDQTSPRQPLSGAPNIAHLRHGGPAY
jgi:hypothetical protein